MRTEAPVSGQNRPPRVTAAMQTGASVRPTARVRPEIPVKLDAHSQRFDPSDPYVRRFWVAAIGPGAVTELLRLIRAAGEGKSVRLPRSLPVLLKAGLVRSDSGWLIVSARIPEVPVELRWRFPPRLAAEHTRFVGPGPVSDV